MATLLTVAIGRLDTNCLERTVVRAYWIAQRNVAKADTKRPSQGGYRTWRTPLSDAFWIASSKRWRVSARSKPGLAGLPSRMPPAMRLKSCAILKGGPAGTAGGTQR